MRKWKSCNLMVGLVCFAVPMNVGAETTTGTKENSVINVQQQSKEVVLEGVVTDKEGNGLPGVSIVVEKTGSGTITDINGHYSLSFAGERGQKIIYSFVGMKSHTYVYNGATSHNVVLESDDIALDDVVVIGYGSKNKKSLTSSIASMDKKQVERLAPTSTSIDNLLGGTIKGVLSTQSSGEPGSTININVRGITSPYPNMSSMNSSNVPLYVIDGVPSFVESNALNPLLTLSPNDIESIDVLKDASATAIYGSRGANGVIIIKTKNGRKGEKVSVDAGYTFSVGNAIKEYDPLNTNEFKNLQDIILKGTAGYLLQNDRYMDLSLYDMMASLGNINADPFIIPGYGIISYTFNSYDGLRNDAFGNYDTDWVKAIRNKNAQTHQYNVAVRGCSERTNYSFSFNALSQEGLYINDKLKRYGARLAVDTEITRRVKVGGTMNYSFSKRDCGSVQEGYGMGIDPWRVRPDVPVYDENSDFQRYDALPAWGYDVQAANPVAQRNLKSNFDSHQFIGNAYMDIDVIKGLKLHADINVATYLFENSYFTPSFAQDVYMGVESPAMIMEYDTRSTYTSVNFRADYNFTKEKHNFAAMAGYGSDRSFNDSKSLIAMDFANENILNNIGSANTYYPVDDSYLRGGLNSVYSRVSYDYATRYLAEVSLRADASSKFGPDNRWGVFPALSLGWRAKNESFLKDVDAVSDLKVRMSWGKTGSTNVADFSYMQYFTKNGSYGGLPAVSLDNTLPNKRIQWEMTTEYNFGLDFAFFNNRLYGSFDVYHRYTDGALAASPHVMESGLTYFTANLIDMTNRGVEFEIGGDIIKTRDFTWSSSLNMSANRNKVKKLNGANLNSSMQDVIIEGEPVGVTKGYRVEGIVQSQAQIDALNEQAVQNGYPYYQDADTGVGDYLLADLDGNGHISVDDRNVIASPQADFFGGWTNTLVYKDFSLSFLMQFTKGGQAVYSALAQDLYATLGQSITRETYGNTWTEETPNAKYPRLVAGRYNSFGTRLNDRHVFDTSYLRMKNVTLSYTLPARVLQMMHLQNASVFASVTNLFTISSWPGLDPELVGTGIYGMSSNDDPYPLSRTFSLGLKFQF